MIDLEVIGHSGGIKASALVVDRTGYVYLEHCTYYGYGKREVRRLFKDYVKDKNCRIVRYA